MIANDEALQDALVTRAAKWSRGGPRGSLLTFTFVVDAAHGPALKSIVDEMSTRVGTRLEMPHRYAKEAALTYAAIALGRLRAAVSTIVLDGDPDYD